MTPRNAGTPDFPRDVQQILRAREVGVRWADNIGEVVTFRYLASRAPVRVAVAAREAPLAVVVLRAVNRDSLEVESGARITWRWGSGTVDVLAVDVSTALQEYDVTVGILKG